MNQFTEHFDSVNLISRTIKNFVYKGKKYPVDFNLVKNCSNYFYNNRKYFKSIDDIEIKPDNYEISDDAIPTFISFCQNKPFDINNTNVFSLHQLSIQYEIPILNNLTNQCITKNKKPLVFQSIFFKLQNQNSKANIDLNPEEDLIASNFFDYINDEQLLLLPISVLYRIINNEKLNFNSMNLTNQGQLIEFLFRCLDKYKREASILFLNLDLENERIDLLDQLFTRYSDVFDFNMINSRFLVKNTSFILSELKKLKIEFAHKISEMESENRKQKDFFVSSQNLFDVTKSQLLNSNRSLEERIQKLENDLLAQKNSQEEQKIEMMKMKEKLNEQAMILEKFTNQKVEKIEINSEPNFLFDDSIITLTASVKPTFVFNDEIEWQVIQSVENSVQIVSKNKKTLILKYLNPTEKVSVVAKATDGSGVTETKEIIIKALKGTIELSVQQKILIKGVIKITEFNGAVLDKSKSKYLLNTSSSPCLGINSYEHGYGLNELVKEISFLRPKGEYYLHVMLVDNFGKSKELVSQKLETTVASVECFYDGNNMFKGILDHLTKISGGNIQTNKTIEITCKDFCCGSIENFVDFNCVDNIHIHAESPRWIQYDFKDRRIQINSYTVKSSNRNAKIKSWVIKISEDGNDWTQIDAKNSNDISELSNDNKTKLIQIQMSQPFRYLRLITYQGSFDNCENDFTIGKLEFFGIIVINQ